MATESMEPSELLDLAQEPINAIGGRHEPLSEAIANGLLQTPWHLEEQSQYIAIDETLVWTCGL